MRVAIDRPRGQHLSFSAWQQSARAKCRETREDFPARWAAQIHGAHGLGCFASPVRVHRFAQNTSHYEPAPLIHMGNGSCPGTSTSMGRTPLSIRNLRFRAPLGAPNPCCQLPMQTP
jgi:hypothetical protein